MDDQHRIQQLQDLHSERMRMLFEKAHADIVALIEATKSDDHA